MTGPPVPQAAFAAALAGLPRLAPHHLRHLLARWAPAEAWARVRSGDVAEHPTRPGGRWVGYDVRGAWEEHARAVDVGEVWVRHEEAGVSVTVAGDPDHPEVLAADPEPPAVLFHRGRPAPGPKVGIVGTRRCTYGGRTFARELGHDLASAGVGVVSGLALGIDGAAHAGALSAAGAPPVAVVGTGVDVVYPRRHADLWEQVASEGWMLSEYPLGTGPEPWRFPARNRLIAGLCDVLVVVESHARGGSLHTVEAAIERGVTVMAVPGSVRTSAAAGTNELLAAGCPPARDAADVLVALGLEAGERSADVAGVDRLAAAGLDDGARRLLDALGGEPATLEQAAMRSGDPLAEVAVRLQRLVAAGHVVESDGWYEPA